MSFSTTAPSIGDSTKQTDYARLLANNVYNKNFRESVSKSANYTVLDTDVFSLLLMTTADADKTVTLPTAADNTDRIIKLMKVDSGTGSCIVDGEGAETINGTTIWEITEQYGYIQIQCDGSEWFVIDQNDSCIYEMSDTTDRTITTSWANYYSLSGLTAGAYEIDYYVFINAGGEHVYVTTATTSAAEDSEVYTSVTLTINMPLAKTFIRRFAAATTLYFNAKATDTASLYNTFSSSLIRAKRIA